MFINKMLIERERQRGLWGATDHLNTEYHWGAYINAYVSRSLIGHPGENEARRTAFKADMVKVAALALAAYDSIED